jgi:hypothetical protein
MSWTILTKLSGVQVKKLADEILSRVLPAEIKI